MYTYIVVDDEMIIRKGLINKINSIRSIELTCVGEASNGIEGIKLIEDKDPDIIITDMKMAKMDGREFLDIIAERYNFKPVIVISGYRSFEYANKAIQNGAISYVLKPFSTEEIEIELKKAVEHLEHEESIKEMKEKASKFEEKKVNDMLVNVILEHYDEVKENQLVQNNIRLNSHQILITVNTRCEKILYVSEQVCKEFLKDISYKIIKNPTNQDQLFILLACKSAGKVNKMKIKSEHIALELIDSIKTSKIYICISECVIGFQQLNKQYLLNNKLLMNIKLTDRCKILRKNELNTAFDEIYNGEYINDIFRKIKYTNKDDIRIILEDFFQGININNYTLGSIGLLCNKLLKRVDKDAKLNNVETEDIMSTYFYKRYLFSNNIDKIQNEISGYISLVMKSINLKNEGYQNTDEKIIKYIDNNYNKKITIEILASQFFISESNCRKIITKTLSKSLHEYLSEIRLNKAKQLLIDTDLNVEQISFEVGYSNPKYFYRKFKKATHYTPLEYRSINKIT